MADYCLKATAEKGSIRAFVSTTSQLVDEARRRHGTSPTATAALGRLLTAAAMMGVTLKGEDTLTLRILGDGPLGALVATANAGGLVRGYVQEPRVHLPSKSPGKLDVGSAVGKNGFLHVTKDLGLKEPYTGSVPLVSGEIAEDLTYYFAVSEQTPTSVALGVLVEPDNSVRAAGGFIVQVMPGCQENLVDQLEKNIGVLPPVSQLILNGEQPEDILARLFQGFEFTIHERQPLKFFCNCSKERMERALISLGPKELQEMIEEQGEAELTCHFCANKYYFSKEELQDILRKMSGD